MSYHHRAHDAPKCKVNGTKKVYGTKGRFSTPRNEYVAEHGREEGVTSKVYGTNSRIYGTKCRVSGNGLKHNAAIHHPEHGVVRDKVYGTKRTVYGTKSRVVVNSVREPGSYIDTSAPCRNLKVDTTVWQCRRSLRQCDILAVKAAASYLEASRKELTRQWQELESLEHWVRHNTGPGLRPGPGFKQKWEVAQQANWILWQDN